MPTFEDALQRVRGDIGKGVGEVFGPFDEAAVTVPEGLEHLIADTEGAVVAVPWIYSCRHIGNFKGLLPTDRPIEMHGVTFVNFTEGEDTPVFHRYIDWLGVVNQLGLEVSWRVPVDEDQYREGRRRMREWDNE
jgi:hypothetical protein